MNGQICGILALRSALVVKSLGLSVEVAAIAGNQENVPSEPLNVRLDQQYEQNVPLRWRSVNDDEGQEWMEDITFVTAYPENDITYQETTVEWYLVCSYVCVLGRPDSLSS